MEAVAVGFCKETAARVFPGLKFSPAEEVLISYYLKRKMEGLEKSVEIIPEADLYNLEPWDLPDKSIVKSDREWFFFCKKYAQKRKATKIGHWKDTRKERDVKSSSSSSSSQVIGTKRTLVFHIGRKRTEWIMHEYSMKQVALDDDALVVCRLLRKKERISQRQQSPNLAPEKHMLLQNGPTSSGNTSD